MQERMRRTTVFEVDLPPTQELMKLPIRESLGRVPNNVVFVPIDFTKQDVQTVLPKAGYHADRKTIFVREGVTFICRSPASPRVSLCRETSAPGTLS